MLPQGVESLHIKALAVEPASSKVLHNLRRPLQKPTWPQRSEVVAKETVEGAERDLAIPLGITEKLSVVNPNESGGEVQNDIHQKKQEDGQMQLRGERRHSKPNPRLSNSPWNVHGEQVAAGWPSWFSAVAGEAISGWTPRRADTFQKIDKASAIGQGTCSVVYKAMDMTTGTFVALKKVRFDLMEPETHDLAGLSATPGIKFTEPQIKCYMNQLLSGLEHCHNRHVLHRGIKGSDLLLNNCGVLKIADFGSGSFFDPKDKQPMTSRVGVVWYRPPELLLGATNYGVGVDLWSAGCVFAELFAGKPIMPGSSEEVSSSSQPNLMRSSIPEFPPSKEMDPKLHDDESRRYMEYFSLIALSFKFCHADGVKKSRPRNGAVRAIPAPEADAELQASLNPALDPSDVPFSSTSFSYGKAPVHTWSCPLADPSAIGAQKRTKATKEGFLERQYAWTKEK
ncbi:hypothetical protein RJ639_010900 [Escallonia herrerae]|uniref:Protein kinase domain-containing protein n=1 Tax=Escallonia herrerae TaxID=1293975 RepID=A0AA88VME0_9ASTE|nr:hypothetical protein RJ639_010900 [Escallonia herrerae]